MGWAVWRRSYLNRNASAASSRLGPSESVAAQGGECARSQSLMTRNADDRDMVIHDGKDASFCRSCRFVCSFIAHLPPFLPTSIILFRFFFYLRLNNMFPRTFTVYSSSHISSFSCFYSATIRLLKLILSSFALAVVITNRDSCHPCACFVGLNHDPFGGCVGSTSTAFPSYLIYWMPTRSLEVQSTSTRHSFLMTVLLFTTSTMASIAPSTPPFAHLSPFLMLFANLS